MVHVQDQLAYTALDVYLYQYGRVTLHIRCRTNLASRPAVRYLKEHLVKFQCSTRSRVQEFLGPVIARTRCITHEYHYDAIKR